VALGAIKDDRTLAQLAEQFDVHANQITAWKTQLESGAADVFGPGGARREHVEDSVENLANVHLASTAAALGHWDSPSR
jgi:transposase-like protein